MRRFVVLGLLAALASASLPATSSAAGAAVLPPPANQAGSSQLRVVVPARATLHQQFQIRVQLTRPVSVAAFETAVLANNNAIEVVAGLPGNGKGRMIDPAFSTSAARVGFYGGTATGTKSDLMDILVTPKRRGAIRIRLALPLGVDAKGTPVALQLPADRVHGPGRRVEAPLAADRRSSHRRAAPAGHAPLRPHA